MCNKSNLYRETMQCSSSNRFSNSVISTGCPTIQSCSDTNYSILVSDSTGLRTQSHKTALPSNASPGSPRLPALLCDLATNLEVPMTHFGVQ